MVRIRLPWARWLRASEVAPQGAFGGIEQLVEAARQGGKKSGLALQVDPFAQIARRRGADDGGDLPARRSPRRSGRSIRPPTRGAPRLRR